MKKYNHARLILLEKINLNYEIQQEIMSEEVASIWVRPIQRGIRKTYIGGIYRQHNILYQNSEEQHDSIQAQERRWNIFINQWETLSNRGHVTVIGDINLDIEK